MTRTTTPDETALRAWVAAVLVPLGYPEIIFDDQRGPEVIPPFASLRRLTDTATAQIERRSTYDEGEDEITVTRRRRSRGTVRISIMGGDHITAARLLDTTQRRTDIQELNLSNGLAILGELAAIQITGRVSGGVPDARSIVDYQYLWIFDDTDAPTGDYVKLVGTEEEFS